MSMNHEEPASEDPQESLAEFGKTAAELREEMRATRELVAQAANPGAKVSHAAGNVSASTSNVHNHAGEKVGMALVIALPLVAAIAAVLITRNDAENAVQLVRTETKAAIDVMAAERSADAKTIQNLQHEIVAIREKADLGAVYDGQHQKRLSAIESKLPKD